MNWRTRAGESSLNSMRMTLGSFVTTLSLPRRCFIDGPCVRGEEGRSGRRASPKVGLMVSRRLPRSQRLYRVMPLASVVWKPPKLQSLGRVAGADLLAAVEIGQGARDAQE